MNLVPKGFVRRVLEALALLVAVAWGANLIAAFLKPLVPVAIVGIVLVGIVKLIFGRRWR